MADFTVQHEGTIIILYPHGRDAQEWIEEHIPEDAQRWGTGIVIEPRYFDAIAEGIREAGLEIE
jgi:hypothetical protein